MKTTLSNLLEVPSPSGTNQNHIDSYVANVGGIFQIQYLPLIQCYLNVMLCLVSGIAV